MDKAIMRLLVTSNKIKTGGTNGARVVLEDILKTDESSKRSLKQDGFFLVNGKYPTDLIPHIMRDIETFYSDCARLTKGMASFIYDSIAILNQAESCLLTLKKATKTNDSFVKYVTGRKDTLSDKLYMCIGKNVVNLNSCIYIKRNKAVEHEDELNYSNRGIASSSQYLYYKLDDNKFNQESVQYKNSIHNLYKNAKFIVDVGDDLANQFMIVDCVYFDYNNQDRETIRDIRKNLIKSIVPLPVTNKLINEISDYIINVCNFIDDYSS